MKVSCNGKHESSFLLTEICLDIFSFLFLQHYCGEWVISPVSIIIIICTFLSIPVFNVLNLGEKGTVYLC